MCHQDLVYEYKGQQSRLVSHSTWLQSFHEDLVILEGPKRGVSDCEAPSGKRIIFTELCSFSKAHPQHVCYQRVIRSLRLRKGRNKSRVVGWWEIVGIQKVL